ncbi:putative polyketide synthase protein [Eutypa lata UCREL1]|uniref:Putative polyketide synthase protein n=1 Tax=Eutypa lata (strain UCR-EL1) TaxID=1287681 RepID=M7SB68_EUTLA|nr:putative polyketide synthase protein [Eutypa lata UCREL1]
MVRPVMFKQAIEQAYAVKGPFDMMIELGPHPALKGPTLQTLQEVSGQDQSPHASLFQREVSSVESIADSLGRLWSLFGSKIVSLKGYDEYVSGNGTFKLAKGLPSYAWDHQTEYWIESRYSRAIRQRGPVHELLGHITPDSTDQDIRWRQIMKPAEVSWLMSHQLQDQIVFPAAGYLVTALEAAMGICHQRNISPCLIELLDVEFGKALVFHHENSDVEIIVSMTDVVPKTPKLLEAKFKYHAGDARGTGPLDLYASGRVQISLGDPSMDILPTRASQPPNLTKICEKDYYSASRDLGYQWTGPFVALDKCWRKLGSATGVLNIVEPSELLISPPVLDAAFQGTLLAYSYPYDGQNWTINVPGKVKRMSVNPPLCAEEVAKAEPLPFDATHDPDMTALYANVDIYPSGTVKNAIVQIEGLTCIPLSMASAHDDKEAFATIDWDVASPDALLVTEDDAFGPEEHALARHLERMAAFYFRDLKNILPAEAESQVSEELIHLLRYADKITSLQRQGATASWLDDWESDTYEELQLAGATFSHTVDVQMVQTMGAMIGRIARGKTSASEVILDNDLLGRFHNDALGPKLYNKYLGRIVKQLAHRNSHMDLLEVGAGTGAATRAILDSIGSSFASYVFTDVSTGFFESAKSWATPYMHKMTFKCLDASQDPISQGFAVQSYDVVVAALVLHATPVLEQTLHANNGRDSALVVREVPTLSYRVLDIEDPCRMEAFTLSEAFLCFQAEMLWQREGKGMSITVEHELVLNKEGRFMIPRVITSNSMNDRYNAAKRPIIGSFNRHTQTVAAVQSNEGPRYELRQEATSDFQNDQSLAVIDVTYSVTRAVRISEFSCLFVALALIRPIDTQIAFADQKTYWLAGLSGGLGLALYSWEDTSIGDMDLDTLLRGTRPKVEGSINLDALFQDNSLEFFIFFSSIVAVVGRPGQTYYSAANMFMASLAEQRRLKGLAASVIHIGPIYGVGYVAQQEEVIVNKEKLRSLALVPVSEREFYQLFSEAVISGRPGPAIRGPIELINGVRRIDWHDNDKPVWATEPMMDHFIRNPDGLATFASDAEFKVPLKTQLTEAGDRDRVYNIILEGLFPKICNIFQIDSSKVDKEALARMRLDEIGIDSLLAVEIRGWFMKTLEVNVPVLKILSGGPIRELKYLIRPRLIRKIKARIPRLTVA